jgi:hypothetical protein
MPKEVYFFDKEGSERIVNDVRWGDEQRSRGRDISSHPYTEINEQIFVVLQQRDPSGKEGWYQAEERVFQDKTWQAPSKPRKFNDSEFNYVRHHKWDDMPLQTIVQIYPLVNVETGEEDWVFYDEVTNPEAFVLHCVGGGTNAGGPEDSWTMKHGGAVLTNVGQAELKPTTIAAPSYLGVAITFADYGYGFQLQDVNYTNIRTQYWVQADGIIVINHPLANLELVGDKTRLEQYHAGDIHIEVFAYSDDDEDDDETPYTRPIEILGDGKWINVTKAGRTWTVAHILPNPDEPKNSMKGISKNFMCDKLQATSVQGVVDWINNQLLANIQELYYDKRGHVYKLTDCDGAEVDRYNEDDDIPTGGDPDIYTNLTSSLELNLVGSQLVPEPVDSTSGLSYKYKVLNNGNNYTNWINTENSAYGFENDLGEAVKVSETQTTDNNPVFDNPVGGLLGNVDGTSGFKWIGGTSIVYCDPLRFRFNSFVRMRASVRNKGLPQTETVSTASCTGLIVPAGDDTVRDWDDPNALGFSFTAGYDINDLNNAYKIRYTFKYADDSLVKFTNTGSNGVYQTQWVDEQMDGSSTTGTIDGIFFDFKEGTSSGDVIKLCIELVTDDDVEYNANADTCYNLSFNNVGDCITDGSGQNVTDSSGDCIETGTVSLPSASCAYPGSGASSPTDNEGYFSNSSSKNAFTTHLANLRNSSLSSTDPLNSGARHTLGPNETLLRRHAEKFDTSAGGYNLRMIMGSINAIGYHIVYYDGTLPAVNNKTYLMHTWTIAHTVPGGTTGNQDFDISSLPQSTTLWIGAIAIPDYNNDYSAFTDVTISDLNQAQPGEIWQCP